MSNIIYLPISKFLQKRTSSSSFHFDNIGFWCNLEEITLQSSGFPTKTHKVLSYDSWVHTQEELSMKLDEEYKLRKEEEMLAMDPKEFSEWLIDSVISQASSEEDPFEEDQLVEQEPQSPKATYPDGCEITESEPCANDNQRKEHFTQSN